MFTQFCVQIFHHLPVPFYIEVRIKMKRFTVSHLFFSRFHFFLFCWNLLSAYVHFYTFLLWFKRVARTINNFNLSFIKYCWNHNFSFRKFHLFPHHIKLQECRSTSWTSGCPTPTLLMSWSVFYRDYCLRRRPTLQFWQSLHLPAKGTLRFVIHLGKCAFYSYFLLAKAFGNKDQSFIKPELWHHFQDINAFVVFFHERSTEAVVKCVIFAFQL